MLDVARSAHRFGLPGGLIDVLGMGLFVGFVAWIYVVGRSLGDAGPGVATAVAAGGAFLLARAIGREFTWVPPLAVVCAAAAVWASDPSGTPSPSPLSGPFGYANATSAFMIQAVLAALMVVVSRSSTLLRAGAGIAAAVLVAVPLLADSRSVVMLILAIPALGLALWGAQGTRIAIAGCCFVLAIGLGGTVLIGALYQPNGSSGAARVVRATLSERRAQLWSEALDIIGEHPLDGVGPGRFAAVSPTAQRDPDARWAHNEFLQVGAETGIPGLALFVGLFGWCFLRLFRLANPGPVAAVGAVALTAIGLHATIDYVLHFPLIPVAAAVVVGSALGSTENSKETFA